MDKNAIKKYAVWARTELIKRVSMKAEQYGISEERMVEPSADSVNGVLLSADEKDQRQALIAQIKDKGYRQVMEEVAYTWFNRFCALRFMEVNGYLPSHVRVFTDEENNFKPQILSEAIHMDLEGLDMDKVLSLKNEEKTEELYKYLLIVQCNALNRILPGMFQKISDYTELLLPENLLREGSVIEQMITMIPENDWKDAVQIIGWLYQYYNSEKKDDVFAALKKNIKITKENIPAATQLFTPDWIVRYMVENSLGRLWLEGHPDAKGQLLPTEEEQASYASGNRNPEDTKWHYYLEEVEQEPEVEAQLAEIRKEYAAMTPDQIKVIDPCCGSGHILAYMFDVLMQIYESYGYATREAVASIVQNNLYGLDIDDRAAQLANFAVMMKARQYDRRFFSRGLQPHVYAIQESNHVNRRHIDFMGSGMDELNRNNAKNQLTGLLDTLYDAKEYGSILNVEYCDWNLLRRFASDTTPDEEQYSFETSGIDKTSAELMMHIDIGEALAQKYDVVVTNPPYMGIKSGMTVNLVEKVKKDYPNSKSDLYAVFIEKCLFAVKKFGYVSMITQHSWMFQSSFAKIRDIVISNTPVNMLHLGSKAFDEIGGEVVQTCSFTINKNDCANYLGRYLRLLDGNDEKGKEHQFFRADSYYTASVKQFRKTDDQVLSYWLSEAYYNLFTKDKVDSYSYTFQGIITGSTEKYLKLWHEICFNHITFGEQSPAILNTADTFYPYNKGGCYRRWYGNRDYVIHWVNNGDDYVRSRTENRNYFFRSGLTWSDLSTGLFSCRESEKGFLFDASGPMIYANNPENTNMMCGYFNSKVFQSLLDINSQGLHYGNGAISSQPIIIGNNSMSEIVENCVQISKNDWDSFETSWDFQRHPFLPKLPVGIDCVFMDDDNKPSSVSVTSIRLADEFKRWERECDDRFAQLKSNEEELNRIFIDIYGLQDELTPEVVDKDITVRKADLGRDIRSFISYAVGCMFGRYSLDEPGLAYAGGEWDASKYKTFPADKDNIIPICDDEYFEDDIVGRFVDYVENIYGSDTLDENLKFIADALGGKGQPKDVIRNYFLNDFYNDHCKIYQKRPIYWQFDSGKKNGFKCLIYMHRYQPDTIARIRTDYVHEQQSRYRTAITDLEQRLANASTAERVKLNKQLKKLQEQADEVHIYEEKIHHLADQMIPIDLDDGVKVNYAKFQDVLAKIK